MTLFINTINQINISKDIIKIKKKLFYEYAQFYTIPLLSLTENLTK